MTTIGAPVGWLEFCAEIRLPQKFDERLQDLMDRNTEGQLTANERLELEGLVVLSEELSLVRGQAMHLLGRKPG